MGPLPNLRNSSNATSAPGQSVTKKASSTGTNSTKISNTKSSNIVPNSNSNSHSKSEQNSTSAKQAPVPLSSPSATSSQPKSVYNNSTSSSRFPLDSKLGGQDNQGLSSSANTTTPSKPTAASSAIPRNAAGSQPSSSQQGQGQGKGHSKEVSTTSSISQDQLLGPAERLTFPTTTPTVTTGVSGEDRSDGKGALQPPTRERIESSKRKGQDQESEKNTLMSNNSVLSGGRDEGKDVTTMTNEIKTTTYSSCAPSLSSTAEAKVSLTSNRSCNVTAPSATQSSVEPLASRNADGPNDSGSNFDSGRRNTWDGDGKKENGAEKDGGREEHAESTEGARKDPLKTADGVGGLNGQYGHAGGTVKVEENMEVRERDFGKKMAMGASKEEGYGIRKAKMENCPVGNSDAGKKNSEMTGRAGKGDEAGGRMDKSKEKSRFERQDEPTSRSDQSSKSIDSSRPSAAASFSGAKEDVVVNGANGKVHDREAATNSLRGTEASTPNRATTNLRSESQSQAPSKSQSLVQSHPSRSQTKSQSSRDSQSQSQSNSSLPPRSISGATPPQTTTKDASSSLENRSRSESVASSTISSKTTTTSNGTMSRSKPAPSTTTTSKTTPMRPNPGLNSSPENAPKTNKPSSSSARAETKAGEKSAPKSEQPFPSTATASSRSTAGKALPPSRSAGNPAEATSTASKSNSKQTGTSAPTSSSISQSHSSHQTSGASKLAPPTSPRPVVNSNAIKNETKPTKNVAMANAAHAIHASHSTNSSNEVSANGINTGNNHSRSPSSTSTTSGTQSTVTVGAGNSTSGARRKGCVGDEPTKRSSAFDSSSGNRSVAPNRVGADGKVASGIGSQKSSSSISPAGKAVSPKSSSSSSNPPNQRFRKESPPGPGKKGNETLGTAPKEKPEARQPSSSEKVLSSSTSSSSCRPGTRHDGVSGGHKGLSSTRETLRETGAKRPPSLDLFHSSTTANNDPHKGRSNTTATSHQTSTSRSPPTQASGRSVGQQGVTSFEEGRACRHSRDGSLARGNNASKRFNQREEGTEDGSTPPHSAPSRHISFATTLDSPHRQQDSASASPPTIGKPGREEAAGSRPSSPSNTDLASPGAPLSSLSSRPGSRSKFSPLTTLNLSKIGSSSKDQDIDGTALVSPPVSPSPSSKVAGVVKSAKTSTHRRSPSSISFTSGNVGGRVSRTSSVGEPSPRKLQKKQRSSSAGSNSNRNSGSISIPESSVKSFGELGRMESNRTSQSDRHKKSNSTDGTSGTRLPSTYREVSPRARQRLAEKDAERRKAEYQYGYHEEEPNKNPLSSSESDSQELSRQVSRSKVNSRSRRASESSAGSKRFSFDNQRAMQRPRSTSRTGSNKPEPRDVSAGTRVSGKTRGSQQDIKRPPVSDSAHLKTNPKTPLKGATSTNSTASSLPSQCHATAVSTKASSGSSSPKKVFPVSSSRNEANSTDAQKPSVTSPTNSRVNQIQVTNKTPPGSPRAAAAKPGKKPPTSISDATFQSLATKTQTLPVDNKAAQPPTPSVSRSTRLNPAGEATLPSPSGTSSTSGTPSSSNRSSTIRPTASGKASPSSTKTLKQKASADSNISKRSVKEKDEKSETSESIPPATLRGQTSKTSGRGSGGAPKNDQRTAGKVSIPKSRASPTASYPHHRPFSQSDSAVQNSSQGTSLSASSDQESDSASASSASSSRTGKNRPNSAPLPYLSLSKPPQMSPITEVSQFDPDSSPALTPRSGSRPGSRQGRRGSPISFNRTHSGGIRPLQLPARVGSPPSVSGPLSSLAGRSASPSRSSSRPSSPPLSATGGHLPQKNLEAGALPGDEGLFGSVVQEKDKDGLLVPPAIESGPSSPPRSRAESVISGSNPPSPSAASGDSRASPNSLVSVTSASASGNKANKSADSVASSGPNAGPYINGINPEPSSPCPSPSRHSRTNSTSSKPSNFSESTGGLENVHDTPATSIADSLGAKMGGGDTVSDQEKQSQNRHGATPANTTPASHTNSSRRSAKRSLSPTHARVVSKMSSRLAPKSQGEESSKSDHESQPYSSKDRDSNPLSLTSSRSTSNGGPHSADSNTQQRSPSPQTHQSRSAQQLKELPGKTSKTKKEPAGVDSLSSQMSGTPSSSISKSPASRGSVAMTTKTGVPEHRMDHKTLHSRLLSEQVALDGLQDNGPIPEGLTSKETSGRK